MAILQAVAAEMAGLDCLVLHTFDATGSEAWQEARRILGELAGSGPTPVTTLVEEVLALGFQWGVSDGN
jgi:hypothetical protein